MLHSITRVSISILQNQTFIIHQDGEKHRVTDTTLVAPSVKVAPSKNPSLVSIPLSSTILGRFTASRFRVSHKLRLVFHRRWGHWKSTWEEEVEIFQPIAEVANERVPGFELMEPMSGIKLGGRSIRCDEVLETKPPAAEVLECQSA